MIWTSKVRIQSYNAKGPVETPGLFVSLDTSDTVQRFAGAIGGLMNVKDKFGDQVATILGQFSKDLEPLEDLSTLVVLEDHRTGARYCECHISAGKLVKFATVDVPLDPDEQADYRANREVVENATAFDQMKDDALMPLTSKIAPGSE